ncbi:MAG: heme lyase CcmF/NrfE family subunit [Pseudomonadota bacterium]
MTAELGHVALLIAFALSLLQSALPLWGAARGNIRLMRTGDATSNGVLVFTLLSFAALMAVYAASDFSVVNVWQNSHSQMPFLFKLTGTWGNHEGSMLLWVLILALFAAAVSWFGEGLPVRLRANVQAVQGLLLATFFAFIIFTSNPFERQVAVAEGQDLNPILQDIGLAIHPPMLYLGYVGFSITFAFAVAALIEGRIDGAWARWVRPWALLAWVFLTAGIAMGSYWAYYELGWGGWWFWDPVENASFLPWLSGTALLHSALVMEKREALKVWTVLLAILTFSLSLLGTFLVRSGVLTSVHTFASDPERGLFILTILCAFIGGSLALFAWRAPRLAPGGMFAPISREGALVVNNLLLATSTATVLIGTLYPVVFEAVTGDKISVGPPFFNLTFIPLAIPLVLLMPLGPLLPWKRADLWGATQRLGFAALAAGLAAIVVLAFVSPGRWLAPLMIGISFWLIIGSFAEIVERIRLGRMSLGQSWTRMRGLPANMWATALAHCGVGITMLGIVAVTAYETEDVVLIAPNATVQAGDYQLTHVGTRVINRNNFEETFLDLRVTDEDGRAFPATPSKRFYPARQMPTTEAFIATRGVSQLYIALGEVQENGSVAVRVWSKPLVLFIWLGTVLMSLAGLISLFAGRVRLLSRKPIGAAASTADA